MSYASGKHSYGISDRSGFRYRLMDMRVEWNGLKVGKDEYEPKHPQLTPRPVRADAEVLRNPRPDTPETLTVYVGRPTVMAPRLTMPDVVGRVGSVEVTTS